MAEKPMVQVDHPGQGCPNDPAQQLTLNLIGGEVGSYALPARRRRRGVARCESPIERQLAFAFADIGGFRWAIPGDDPHCLGSWEALPLALLAQPQVGPYRPDFGVARLAWRPGDVPPVVVECDGFAYHDLTRAQADRDRLRDRYYVGRGAAVLRFSGREIARDAAGCAREVWSYLSRNATFSEDRAA